MVLRRDDPEFDPVPHSCETSWSTFTRAEHSVQKIEQDMSLPPQILRIKRKRDEDPVDALCLCSYTVLITLRC